MPLTITTVLTITIALPAAAATCDTHHGDNANQMPKKGVDPDALKVIVTDALELIGARRSTAASLASGGNGVLAPRPSPSITVL